MRRKTIFLLSLILILAVGSIIVYSKFIRGNNNKLILGQVKYFDLEGGFYGVIDNEGKIYLPINLSSEFKVDGLKIRFTYKEVENSVNIYMRGIPVEIEKIEKY